MSVVTQTWQEQIRPGKVVIPIPLCWRHNRKQPGRFRRAQAVDRILERHALVARHANGAEHLVINIWCGFLVFNHVTRADGIEPASASVPRRGIEQGVDIVQCRGGGDTELQSRLPCSYQQSHYAGTKREVPVLDQFLVYARLGTMNHRYALAQRTTFDRGELQRLDVMPDAFLAAGHFKQFFILFASPVPIKRHFHERGVKRLTMQLLGIGERAIDIEYQCAQHVS